MKKGVSLIVLSITILVMAILAATVIISLEDSGIIGRSKKTVNSSNFADEYTRLTVIKNGILTDNLGTITIEEFINELKAKGIIEDAVIDNTDGTKTITTKSGFEVVIGQSQSSDLNIALKDNEDNSFSDTPNEEPKVAQATFMDGTTLSWEELKLEANGQKYYYNAAAITDTEIGDRAFYDCREIVSLNILEGVTKIGDEAFANCNIADVNIPSSVAYIGENAFWDNGIMAIYIPASVTYIGPGALFHMKEINIAENNPNYCSINGVFYNKARTKLIKYPFSKTEDSFVIPDTVIYFEETAFLCETGPKSITLPSGLTGIDGEDFNETVGLENIYVNPNNPNYTSLNGVLYTKDMQTLVKYPCRKSAESYTVPSTVKTIGRYAFNQNTGPLNLIIQDNGYEIIIDANAFIESPFETITLPSTITAETILALNGSFMLQEIIYNGTVAQWNALGLDEYQYELYLPPVDVICSNGTVTLKTALGE